MRILKWVGAVLVLVVMAFGAYGWLDTAISLDYARTQQQTERERSELLRQLVLVSNRGAQRAELAATLERTFGKEHLIKEGPDRISVDDIVFRFDETQSLKEVQFLGEAEE